MYLSRPSVTNVLSLLASVEVIAAAVPGESEWLRCAAAVPSISMLISAV